MSSTKIPRSARAWACLPTSTQRRGAPNRVRGTHPPRSRSRPSGDSGSTANEQSARSAVSTSLWLRKTGRRDRTAGKRVPAPGARRQLGGERDAGLGSCGGVCPRWSHRALQARASHQRGASHATGDAKRGGADSSLPRHRRRRNGSFDAAFETRRSPYTTRNRFRTTGAVRSLAYGERLRRAGRRRHARERLRASDDGVDDEARRHWSRPEHTTELAATGERLRPRADVARESLTPREMQVALAVAEGATNQETAAALYLTPKTVEYHLTRVYRKLGVRSRAELVRRFTQRAESA